MTRFCLAAACALVCADATAQSAPVLRLTTPDGTLSEQFTLVRGVRELPDGRLLLTDWLEQRLAVADFRTQSVTDIGRTGSGPGEYRLPSALLPFRGDSTILVDLGNTRLTVLDANGRAQRTLRPPVAAAQQPFGADTRGRIYFSIPAWHAARPLPGDSIELAVWNTANDSVRAVTRVHGYTPSQQKPGEGPRIPYVVFAPQDTWTVSPAGRVAVVRAAGYYVEWIDDRGRSRGARQETRPEPATAADRRAAARTFAQNSAVGGRATDNPSGMSAVTADMLSDAEVARLERASTFAPNRPAFRAGSAVADGAGRLWVGRWDAANSGRNYDVFDAAGARIATVQLAIGRHLIGVGRAHAYVAFTDGDGLQHIERYRLPPLVSSGR
jgi:hypothetical protein